MPFRLINEISDKYKALALEFANLARKHSCPKQKEKFSYKEVG